MSISSRLLLTDNVRRPNGSAPGPGGPDPSGYEPEHSERQVSGSVNLGRGVRWLASLAVPMTGNQTMLLTIERQGPLAPGAPAADDVALVIPPGEVDAVVTLLQGIVTHARRDGVLGA